jgi:transposase
VEIFPMSRCCQLTLSDAQRRRLLRWRDHHRKPYLRERAAAILKVADGWSLADVATYGLLRPRSRNSVAGWVERYRQHGLNGLTIRPGGGRKPAFSPLGT